MLILDFVGLILDYFGLLSSQILRFFSLNYNLTKPKGQAYILEFGLRGLCRLFELNPKNSNNPARIQKCIFADDKVQVAASTRGLFDCGLAGMVKFPLLVVLTTLGEGLY